jgi:hypothetical protein
VKEVALQELGVRCTHPADLDALRAEFNAACFAIVYGGDEFTGAASDVEESPARLVVEPSEHEATAVSDSRVLVAGVVKSRQWKSQS